MQTLAGNTYGLTSATAIPAIGVPNTGARGTITGGALRILDGRYRDRIYQSAYFRARLSGGLKSHNH